MYAGMCLCVYVVSMSVWTCCPICLQPTMSSAVKALSGCESVCVCVCLCVCCRCVWMHAFLFLSAYRSISLSVCRCTMLLAVKNLVWACDCMCVCVCMCLCPQKPFLCVGVHYSVCVYVCGTFGMCVCTHFSFCLPLHNVIYSKGFACICVCMFVHV